MELKIKTGIDKALFGMKFKDIEVLFGEPDAIEIEEVEDENVLYIYNKQKFRFTFYEDEDLRMAYILSANSEAQLHGKIIIGSPVEEIKLLIGSVWEENSADITKVHYHEDSWFTLYSEFDVVTKFEFGAGFTDDDEFDWKF